MSLSAKSGNSEETTLNAAREYSGKWPRRSAASILGMPIAHCSMPARMYSEMPISCSKTLQTVARGGTASTPGTGFGVNPDYSNFLGTELTVTAGWFATKYALLEGGYGHFFHGACRYHV